MDKRLIALAGVALICGATQAEAAVTLSMAGGNSATIGPSGNIATYSSGSLSVQASAWSLNGPVIAPAWLGQYSDGVGVTNQTEGSGTILNSNTIDNQSGTDFVLLVFNQAVGLQSAALTPYQVSSAPANNAATASYATLAGAYTSPTPTPISLSSSVWLSLVGNAYSVMGNTTAPYSVGLNPSNNSGNVWLLAAGNFGGASSADGFRLTSITVTTPPSAVPEPSTWMIFCLGLAGFGMLMRQRTHQRQKLLQLA